MVERKIKFRLVDPEGESRGDDPKTKSRGEYVNFLMNGNSSFLFAGDRGCIDGERYVVMDLEEDTEIDGCFNIHVMPFKSYIGLKSSIKSLEREVNSGRT